MAKLRWVSEISQQDVSVAFFFLHYLFFNERKSREEVADSIVVNTITTRCRMRSEMTRSGGSVTFHLSWEGGVAGR